MDKALILTGILLFLVGSAFIIGAYFIFNQYSVSGSHNFQGYLHETWRFPNTPLELSEGDKVTIKMIRLGNFDGRLYIKSSSGEQVLLSDRLRNSTLYYYVQKNDLYYLLIEISGWGSGSVHSATLETTIIQKSPNFLFLLVGILILFGSTLTISIAFLHTKLKADKITHASTLPCLSNLLIKIMSAIFLFTFQVF